MSEGGRPESKPLAMSDWEVEQLADHLDALLTRFLADGDTETAAAVVGLFEGIERLHAEGLRRLAELVARDQDLITRARRDPVISSLFELYELSVPEIEATGGAASMLDPGGVSPTGDVSVVPAGKLVELRRRLDDRSGSASDIGTTSGIVDLDRLQSPGLSGHTIGRASVLVVRDDDRVAAFRNVCPGSPLPLHLGTLEQGELMCPWHGCRFDAETGARRDEDGPALTVLDTRVEDGHLLISIV